ncbi:MAG TPA: glycosyltransferase family 39 protein [Nitrososphaeraceae archaeon]
MLKQQINLTRQECLLLIIIIALASIIRLWSLSDIGFNNDEAIYSGQAATLAGYEEFGKFFSIHRAHPLFLQFIISILFENFGISDTIARIVPAILGVTTVFLTYLIGKMLYDTKVAIAAALVITVLPYHTIISREVLLDVPLSFFFTLTLFFVICYMKNTKGIHWLYLIGVSSGLSFLSKEVGIFALICSILCLLLIRGLTPRNLLIVISSFVLATSPYWLPILTIEEAQAAFLYYWQWQTEREPNHPDTFYLELVSREALGYGLTILCIASIVSALITGNIKKPAVYLLLVWISIPLFIFQFLPIKGYHFVVSVIPSFTLLGVSVLFGDWMKKVPYIRIIPIIVIPLIFLSSGSVLNYLFGISPPDIAGSGGEPYAREAAIWIRDNLPNDSVLLTLDTPMANIIKYYSNNEVFSLHSNKNPAYTKIETADLSILSGQIHYLVYESYRAERSAYLKEEAEEMNDLRMKYDAVPIYIQYKGHIGGNNQNLTPAIIIYSLDRIQG